MNTESEPPEPESPSLRYWKAAIYSLPPEKRDAAWEFYLNRLVEGNTGDTLSALILLLEANGIYLEQLPERYHHELISPLSAELVSLQQRLAEHEARQREITAALEKASRQSVDASTRALTATLTVAGSLRGAATAIDTRQIVKEVKDQIEKGALQPMVRQLQELASGTTRISEATNSARAAVETWKRVHICGIILAGWGIGAVIFAGLFLFAWTRLERNTERHLAQVRDQLTADVRENQGTVRKLVESGVSIRIVSATDFVSKSNGGSLALIIEPAAGADFDDRNGPSRGIVYLKPAAAN